MLTRKQLELLELIDTRMKRDGVPPSFDEMKDALNLRSKSGIHRLITALEERGFIRRLAHRARAIEVVRLPEAVESRHVARVIEGGARPAPAAPPAPARAMPVAAVEAMDLPVMGRIAAGTPIEAISEVSHHIAVPGSMLSGRGAHYALEVRGDSMIEAGIHDGDIVVIREQTTAENGDIVVALVEGHEATLKRFRRQRGMIALEAANPAYETRVLRDDQVQVQGRLVGLIRGIRLFRLLGLLGGVRFFRLVRRRLGRLGLSLRAQGVRLGLGQGRGATGGQAQPRQGRRQHQGRRQKHQQSPQKIGFAIFHTVSSRINKKWCYSAIAE